MNITRLSIKRPVGISMIVAFFVVLGCYSYYRIGVELLPALNTPYVTVRVKYPGASAESVEQEIVKPIEDAVSSVSNVKKITSTASYEQARVGLELEFDADADADYRPQSAGQPDRVRQRRILAPDRVRA